MKPYSCRVIENRTLWANVQLLTLDAPDLARTLHPGQAALARETTTLDPYLRRTLWLYASEDARVSFTLAARDPLAVRVRAGDALDLLAPIGRAITFDPYVRRIVLLGEGVHTARLVALAHAAIRQAHEVVLATHAASANEIFPAHLLAPEIEYRANDALGGELIAWADAVIASGSLEFYHALANTVRATRYQLEPGFARALIDLPLPCGTGACGACAVETARGVRLACADGPAFDLSALVGRGSR